MYDGANASAMMPLEWKEISPMLGRVPLRIDTNPELWKPLLGIWVPQVNREPLERVQKPFPDPN